ncbi:MAG: hypothetical protein AcusKO_04530 [Acuticoccus sp.]
MAAPSSADTMRTSARDTDTSRASASTKAGSAIAGTGGRPRGAVSLAADRTGGTAHEKDMATAAAW